MNQPKQDTCPLCIENKREIKLQRLIKHLEDGTQTNTITYVCVNPECHLSINVKKLKTWNAN